LLVDPCSERAELEEACRMPSEWSSPQLLASVFSWSGDVGSSSRLTAPRLPAAPVRLRAPPGAPMIFLPTGRLAGELISPSLKLTPAPLIASLSRALSMELSRKVMTVCEELRDAPQSSSSPTSHLRLSTTLRLLPTRRIFCPGSEKVSRCFASLACSFFGLFAGLPACLGGVDADILPLLLGVTADFTPSTSALRGSSPLGPARPVERGVGALGSGAGAVPADPSTYLRLRGMDFPFLTWMR
jgi:hypothetical protein